MAGSVADSAGQHLGIPFMPPGRLVIGTRRYSSWSMRGWLAVQLAALEVEVVVVPLAGAGPGGTAGIAEYSPSGLVPYLEHGGNRMWETLAICEYCAEQEPHLWPYAAAPRAHARSIAAEMHAGFGGLRRAMPMNLGRHVPGAGQTEEALADLRRIEAIWAEALDLYGGPYLFGTRFSAADAMYAPIVTRLLTYAPDISAASRAYCDAVRAHPLVDTWYGDAAQEPAAWLLPKYESVT